MSIFKQKFSQILRITDYRAFSRHVVMKMIVSNNNRRLVLIKFDVAHVHAASSDSVQIA